ncbi:MAG: iron-sulfur cluster repair di-iron protein [Acidobacteriota bacterium]|nr:iron-sulfur cluster repair di-iron protein [Acidobacteriota bacterium]
MNADATRPVKAIVNEFPAAARVFESVGIDYCCGGEMPLQDACKEAHVKVEEILRLIKDDRVSDSSEKQLANWIHVPLPDLIEYIVKKHHGYCRKEQERLEPLLAKVVQVHGDRHPELKSIQLLFNRMTHELAQHLPKEEKMLFPIILGMSRASLEKEPMPRLELGAVQNPVSMMILEHDECGRILKEMHSLSHGYEPPADACGSYQSLYQGLKEFEEDMHHHVYLENYVLFPRTVSLEKQFGARRAEAE